MEGRKRRRSSSHDKAVRKRLRVEDAGSIEGGSGDYAPAHVLEAQDFECPRSASHSPFLTLPAEVIARIGGLFNARDLAAFESTCRNVLAVCRRHVWPTLRTLKVSHYGPPPPPSPQPSLSSVQASIDAMLASILNTEPLRKTSSERGESSSAQGSSPDAANLALLQPASIRGVQVTISVGNQYTEDVVSEEALAAIARRLSGLRTLTFGVQARIQSKAQYEEIYHEPCARGYRDRSERLMGLVANNLPEKLSVTSFTVGSYFEMASATPLLIQRMAGTVKSITMSFRWVHRDTTTAEELRADLDCWERVWRSIRDCGSLEVLKVYKTSMAELGSAPVLAAVKGKPGLSRLCLVCEGFSGTNMAHIIAGIPAGNLRVLFLEPNGGTALDELRSDEVWRAVGKEPPSDPSLQLGRLRKFGFSSRDHLSLPRTIAMLPALWEILIVGRHAGQQLLTEVSDLTVDYLLAKRRAPTVKPICIRIHTEDDRWRERDPADPEYQSAHQRDEAFGRDLMESVKHRTKCHTVRMEVAGKWGFRDGNASVVVTGEKPQPPPPSTQ